LQVVRLPRLKLAVHTDAGSAGGGVRSGREDSESARALEAATRALKAKAANPLIP
jgi:hypothetical protein